MPSSEQWAFADLLGEFEVSCAGRKCMTCLFSLVHGLLQVPSGMATPAGEAFSWRCIDQAELGLCIRFSDDRELL